MDHIGRFLQNWVRTPRELGALVPSSRLLGKLMATNISAGARVIELGAGTGSVTRAILDSGVRPEDLYLVERNEEFAAILRRRFPRSPVIQADACSLTEHAADLPNGIDFIVSGLPLLLFPKARKMRILSQAFAFLRPDGYFHQFTYRSRCPVGRETCLVLRLASSLIGFTPLNLPPAFVYRLARKPDSNIEPAHPARPSPWFRGSRLSLPAINMVLHECDVQRLSRRLSTKRAV
jgi:phosphatidylethanolamine/phosphatidyl-N-methylethanolamine N-methyltransferase